MSLVRYQLCVTPQQYNTCIHNTQALANLAPSWYYSAEAAYRRGDVEDLHIQATTFIEVLEDLERVLATRREFLLGPWLEAAKVTDLKVPSDDPGTGHNGCRVEVVRVQCKEPDHALGTRR